MKIRKYLDAFMAKLGYVRAPAAEGETITMPLTIEVDSSQVREALELLEKLNIAGQSAEAVIASMAEASNAVIAAVKALDAATGAKDAS